MNSLLQKLTSIPSTLGVSKSLIKHNILGQSFQRCYNVLSCTQLLKPSLTGPNCINLTFVRHNIMEKMHKSGPLKKQGRVQNIKPLGGAPQLKGVVLKTLIKKPIKPNSGNRKCVQVRLSSGRVKVVFVPGEGHNLQEHQTVLVSGGRLKGVPGVRLRCVRGKFDLPHVSKKIDLL